MNNFNQLTNAESERLVKLIEECVEVQKEACKILRFGYTSYHPSDPDQILNRYLLETEIGNLLAAIDFMLEKLDISKSMIEINRNKHKEGMMKYLLNQKG